MTAVWLSHSQTWSRPIDYLGFWILWESVIRLHVASSLPSSAFEQWCWAFCDHKDRRKVWIVSSFRMHASVKKQRRIGISKLHDSSKNRIVIPWQKEEMLMESRWDHSWLTWSHVNQFPISIGKTERTIKFRYIDRRDGTGTNANRKNTPMTTASHSFIMRLDAPRVSGTTWRT